jgi:Skp family chaperone for outer membrane proteins
MKMKKIIVCAGIALAFAAVRGSAVEIPLDRSVVSGNKETTAIGYVDIEKIFAEHPLKKRLQEEYMTEVDKRKNEIAQMDAVVRGLEKVVVSSATEVARAKLELDILKSMCPRQEPFVTSALIQGTTESITGQNISSAAFREPAISATLPHGTTQSAVVIPQGPDAAVIRAKEAAIMGKEAVIDVIKKDIETKRDEMGKKIRQNKADLAQMEEKQTASVLADMYKILQKVAADENVTIIIDKNDVLYGQASQDMTDRIRERLQGR